MSQPGNEVATTQQYETGLEDFGPEDLRMPRLSIDHETGEFVDSLSGARLPAINTVILGLVKQRVLWPPQVAEDGSMPLCKSQDNLVGYPTTNARRASDNFPWAAAGWQETDFPPDQDGRIKLPCGSCRLKEWASHPDGKKTWCSELHTIPLLYAAPGEEPLAMALFTTQRSSINGSKNYFGGIVRQGLPAYAFYAEITLSARQRGKNTYYVPIFTMKGPSDQTQWPAYSSAYAGTREFLHRPPLLRDSEGNVVDPDALSKNNVIQGQPVQQQQPVQQSWAQPAPQQVPQQPVAQPVPTQPPAAQAWPTTTAPTTPFLGGSSARDADDDLPF